MKTTINAQPADWPVNVWDLWQARVVPRLDPEKPAPHTANYFTARPYVDQYNRGSDKAGFCYTVGREVYLTEWSAR
jgi:hypothetical protein